jgi:predicted metal-dependent phosphoesterase TrpH
MELNLDYYKTRAKEYHRKLQKAEARIKELEEQLKSAGISKNWESRERQIEAKERDAAMDIVAKVEGLDTWRVINIDELRQKDGANKKASN